MLATSPDNRVFSWLGLRLSGGELSQDQGRRRLDLERELFSLCVYLGKNKEEGRLASVVKSWLLVHGSRVNTGKLAKLRKEYFETSGEDVELLRYFAYYNHRGLKRHSWKVLTESIKKGGDNFYAFSNEKMSRIALERFGLESFLPKNTTIKIHKGAFRERPEDVLSPEELAAVNKQYLNRILFGCSPRADVSTFYKDSSFSSTKDLAKFICFDQETVRKTAKDLILVDRARGEL